MEDRCRQEVVELHRFFEQWFNGDLPDDDARFERFGDVLAEDFEIIGPEGRRVERDAVVQLIRSANGARAEGGFSIEVKNLRSRTVGNGMVLVTYEEHQVQGGKPRSWLSSALFRAHKDRPNGVEWLHVQETYLPDDNS